MTDRTRLTVVIPSRGRRPYLRRTVDYLLDIGVRVSVLEDASAPDKSLAALHDGNSRFQYFCLPDTSVQHRLSHGTSQVTSDFCMWSSDDEFVTATGIDQCIEALDANDWVGCSGQTLRFWPTKKIVHMRTMYAPTDLVSTTIDARIWELLSDYSEPLLWNFYRTAVLRRAAGAMALSPSTLGGVTELTHAASIAIEGVVRPIDAVLRLRSDENQNQWKPVSDKFPSFQAWWHSSLTEVGQLLDLLTDYPPAMSSAQMVDRNSLIRSFEAYMQLNQLSSDIEGPTRESIRQRLAPYLGTQFHDAKFWAYRLSLSSVQRQELSALAYLVRQFHDSQSGGKQQRSRRRCK